MDRQSAGRIDYFVAVDGVGLSAVGRAVGSHRYRVTVRGPGGHSYGDFGIPNPVHALGRAIAGISAIQVPSSPKTTFNVGMIEGGTSVNSIAMAAAMEIDLRSENQTALDSLDARARRAVAQGIENEHQRWPGGAGRLTVEWREIGKRPAAGQPDTSAGAPDHARRRTRPRLRAGDHGIEHRRQLPDEPGHPVGHDRWRRTGGGTHSLGEWYDDGMDGWKGPQWALLLVLSLAGVIGDLKSGPTSYIGHPAGRYFVSSTMGARISPAKTVDSSGMVRSVSSGCGPIQQVSIRWSTGWSRRPVGVARGGPNDLASRIEAPTRPEIHTVWSIRDCSSR